MDRPGPKHHPGQRHGLGPAVISDNMFYTYLKYFVFNENKYMNHLNYRIYLTEILVGLLDCGPWLEFQSDA